MGSTAFATTALIGLRAIQPTTDHCDSVPIWYSFDLVKDRGQEGGWTQEITERELASPRSAVGIRVRLEAGASRELHSHNTDQWAYLLCGNARVTIMNEDGTMFIGDLSEGDISVLPAGYSHSIHGLSPDGTQILLVFPHVSYSNNDRSIFRSGWPTR
jgi:oxalate decarboxylase